MVPPQTLTRKPPKSNMAGTSATRRMLVQSHSLCTANVFSTRQNIDVQERSEVQGADIIHTRYVNSQCRWVVLITQLLDKVHVIAVLQAVTVNRSKMVTMVTRMMTMMMMMMTKKIRCAAGEKVSGHANFAMKIFQAFPDQWWCGARSSFCTGFNTSPPLTTFGNSTTRIMLP